MRRGLSFPTLLALRYLRSARRDAAVSFLSAVAAGGIALGVAALVLALAALSGLQRALRGEILARTPQLEIELAPGVDAAATLARLQGEEGVRAAQQIVRGRGWVAAAGTALPVELVGYGDHLPASFPESRSSTPGLYLGDSLAMRLGLGRGETVEIVSSRSTLTPLGLVPRSRRLALAGTFHTGRTEREERAALPLAEARLLLPAAPSRIEVTTAGLDEALRLAERLRHELPAGSIVSTWQDLNRPLFFALGLEKRVMFVGVFLIVLVAALALVADLALILSSKWHEIGALAAMGASAAALRRAFTTLGALLAGLGALTGGVVGTVAAWVLDRWKVVALPGQVYFIDYLPFSLRPTDLLAVVGATLALALGFAAWGARRAGLVVPAEAIRR